MDLHRLKIELTNAITAELQKRVKSDEGMVSHYAINFMESGEDGDRDSYRSYRAKAETMELAINIAQDTSRGFTFDIESE